MEDAFKASPARQAPGNLGNNWRSSIEAANLIFRPAWQSTATWQYRLYRLLLLGAKAPDHQASPQPAELHFSGRPAKTVHTTSFSNTPHQLSKGTVTSPTFAYLPTALTVNAHGP